jgi:hypothetical protein
MTAMLVLMIGLGRVWSWDGLLSLNVYTEFCENSSLGSVVTGVGKYTCMDLKVP